MVSTTVSCSVARSAASRWTKVVIPTLSISHGPTPLPWMVGPLERTTTASVGTGYRTHATTTSDNPIHAPLWPPLAVQVPPTPSWSVRDLRLASIDDDDDCEISEEELATLARRCLIDVRRLSPERREKLRVHVAGIMRCASVLLESKALRVDGCENNGREGRGDLTDEEMYDAPRGLTKMPIRRERDGELDDWELSDSRESKAIMRSESVRSKMVKSDDNEMYFSVVTKRS